MSIHNEFWLRGQNEGRMKIVVVGMIGVAAQAKNRLIRTLSQVKSALINSFLPDIVKGNLETIEIVKCRNICRAGIKQEGLDTLLNAIASGNRHQTNNKLFLRGRERVHEPREVAGNIVIRYSDDPGTGCGRRIAGRRWRRIQNEIRAVDMRKARTAKSPATACRNQ